MDRAQSSKTDPIAGSRRPTWIMLVLAVCLLFGALALGLEPLSSMDLGLHIRSGELIWQQRLLPATDPFSYTAPQAALTCPEWLAQIKLYWIDRLAGVPGLVLFKALLLLAAFGLTAWAIRGNLLLSASILLACTFVAHSHMQLAPDLFSWALIGGLLVLQRLRYGPGILVLLVLWANLHPSFVLAAALSAIWAVEQYYKDRDNNWLVWVVLFTFAPCLNPYGPRLYLLFFEIRPYLSEIGEWRRYPLNSPHFWVLVAYLSVLAVDLFLRQRGRVWDGLRLVLLAGLAAMSLRHSVAAMLFLAPSLAWRFGPYFSRLGNHAYLTLAGVIGLAAIGGGTWLTIHDQAFRLELNRRVLPIEAVQFIERHEINGRMFNDYRFGGYLIWRLWPERKVFIDGRLEVYGRTNVLADYLETINAGRGWADRLDGYEIDYILVGLNRPLTRRLLEDPDWELVYFDYTAAIFLRAAFRPEVRRIEQITPWGKRDAQQLSLAIDEARYLLAENPQFENGHLMLAQLLHAAGDEDGAAAEVNRFLELYPQGRRLDAVRSLQQILGQGD